MIRKSGHRFSGKIMLNKKAERDNDSKKSHHALGGASQPVFRIPSSGSARRLRKKVSTSRDSVSAIAVSSLDADSTDSAAVEVLPIASLSEPMLMTSVSLP